jgi:hypothetical protein
MLRQPSNNSNNHNNIKKMIPSSPTGFFFDQLRKKHPKIVSLSPISLQLYDRKKPAFATFFDGAHRYGHFVDSRQHED